MNEYYICLNCGRIQSYHGDCEKCRGVTHYLNNEEVSEYKEKVFKKKIERM